jgi:hypothetical protein
MTNEATQLMAEALRVAKLDGSFSPAELGAKIGLKKPQAEAAARELSNAGVLVLGFDCSANFSPDFRKVRAKADAKAARAATPGRGAGSRAAVASGVASAGDAPARTSPGRPAGGRKRRTLAEPAARR